MKMPADGLGRMEGQCGNGSWSSPAIEVLANNITTHRSVRFFASDDERRPTSQCVVEVLPRFVLPSTDVVVWQKALRFSRIRVLTPVPCALSLSESLAQVLPWFRRPRRVAFPCDS